jgi:ribose 5-phosphate isomerase A
MAIDRASSSPPPRSGDDPVETFKLAAAVAAANLVQDGMRVGLGTGSTVAHLLPALAQRKLKDIRCVATSPATQQHATALGLPLSSLDALGGELEVAIDGADQISPEGWLIKGGGGAHTREKIVACSAHRFVVIVSAEKLVQQLHPPVPLELLSFGVSATLAALSPAELRDAPASPDGNLIADYRGPIADPRSLAARLSGTPGVVEHGLCEPQIVSEILVGDVDGVRRLAGGKPAG